MKIAGDDLGLETVEAAEIVDRFLEGTSGLYGFEVADVLAEKDVLADADRDCVFEMATDREHRREFARHPNSKRCVSTGTAENSGAASREAHDGIVTGAHDGAIVHQKMVGDVFEAHCCFVIRDGDGLVAAIAAGGDQRESALLH